MPAWLAIAFHSKSPKPALAALELRRGTVAEAPVLRCEEASTDCWDRELNLSGKSPGSNSVAPDAGEADRGGTTHLRSLSGRAPPGRGPARGVDHAVRPQRDRRGRAGLGAQAGEDRLRHRGGFSRFRSATQTPFNIVLEVRP